MDKITNILKSIYETFGTPYPKLSLIVVACLGAGLFAGVWIFAAKQVAKDHQASVIPSQVGGSASTSGNNSPAVTGSGNSFNYDQSSSVGNKPKAPNKE
jgi:hypothetical protein